MNSYEQEMVDDAGAIALRRVAAQLVQTLPHDVGTDEQSLLVSASALVRVTLEVDKGTGGMLRFVRFTADQPWIFTSEDRVAVVRELGKAADIFATREILAGEVERELSDIVSGTALEGLARDKLARLANNTATDSPSPVYPSVQEHAAPSSLSTD